ncbi:Trk system potassium transporter TrkA [Pelagicoccus sp. SDUM812003]|uniref:Trk system potassium transporter TrkA n=1 Tax=Pelagicoccus sp. SDUM812003 TaxID=3041267 RepID=UPI00280E973B|nr:Trk system potassium transporter TrkA [Pelagicoccus sp. SDUM812003]MDQ8202827.1 Trk system potassium transporter TrkA [Pelagicoccus sp. SDUM812003]
MKIVIVGAGEVGTHLSETLSVADHDVTVIERDETLADALSETIDARVIKGNGSSASALLRAGVNKCDFFLAMTSSDEINLVSASLAKALGAEKTFARAHDSTYRDNSLINHQRHFGIDHLVNPEALAAVELAKRIRNPGRVAVEDFGRGQIEVKSIEIQQGAKVVNIPLKELRLPGNIRIGLINREGENLVANANTTLKVGDQVTVFGHPDSLFETKALFDPSSKGSAKIAVTILSGSEIAISLARLLSNPRFKIRIIEKDLKLCQSLAERLPNVTMIHGDGTSLRVLEEEEVGHSDFFVACRKDDEDNIMTCLQAFKLGAKHTMLAINRADYIEILEKLSNSLGVELAVSPRVAATNEVLRYIGKKPFIELEENAQGAQDSNCIIELDIAEKSAVAGKRIRDVAWPKECVLVGHEHNYMPKTPTGDDVLQAGDSIIAIICKSRIKELLKLTK